MPIAKKPLIIFGRSPFIDTVDVPKLLAKYPSYGFNQFGKHYRVDCLFMFDRAYRCAFDDTQIIAPYYLRDLPKTSLLVAPKPSDKPLLPALSQDGRLVLGFRYFTVSMALNYALLQGFNDIYLVGIDHVETDERFKHFDGDDRPSKLTPDAHRRLKQYVYKCQRPGVKIWQTNPAVRNQWELPFKEISELY